MEEERGRNVGGAEAVLPCSQQPWFKLLALFWFCEVRYWYRGSRRCRFFSIRAWHLRSVQSPILSVTMGADKEVRGYVLYMHFNHMKIKGGKNWRESSIPEPVDKLARCRFAALADLHR